MYVHTGKHKINGRYSVMEGTLCGEHVELDFINSV